MSLLSPRLARSLLTAVRPRSIRPFSSTPFRLNATPEWRDLIGGREAIEKKKKAYESKYAAVMEEKAKQEGLSVEELKERKLAAVQAAKDKERALEESLTTAEPTSTKPGPVEAGSEEVSSGPEVVRPAPSAGDTPKAAPRPPKKSDSPVKPLHDIMDLSKASTLSTPEISQLWTGYHQSKGFLSAAIPTEIYERMTTLAKRYPMFVLPLTRDVEGELPEGLPEGVNGAVEMHLLEWAFLPPPSTVVEPVPSPSTVLFTPLAEYQARQAYAQPYLILTHYSDLSKSHGVVLMRGEISDNVSLNAVDAQILAVRLQLFYNPAGIDGERDAERQDLLTTFHEKPAEFDVDKLINLAWDLK